MCVAKCINLLYLLFISVSYFGLILGARSSARLALLQFRFQEILIWFNVRGIMHMCLEASVFLCLHIDLGLIKKRIQYNDG